MGIWLRFFLLPGVGHCGGGEGPSQIDTLSPLMAWVEQHQTPKMLVAGKTVQAANPGGGPGAPGQPGPGNANGGGPGQGGPNAGAPRRQFGEAGISGGGGGGRGPSYPYAAPPLPAEFTRPIYPFPYIAKYTGKGDPNDAANYQPVKSTIPVPQVFDHETAKLLGPNTQKFYHVENGELVADKAK